MHRVETDPAHERIQEHLNSFAHAFPPGFIHLPERVHVVLSYEGRTREDRIIRHRERMLAHLDALHPSRTRGGQLRWRTSCHPDLFRHGAPETAWEAVKALFPPPRD
jgi:hypothetical protein